jgi:hypothetical protein
MTSRDRYDYKTEPIQLRDELSHISLPLIYFGS